LSTEMGVKLRGGGNLQYTFTKINLTSNSEKLLIWRD
jgi:hypothetical protein